jgi:hypothetical protein
MRFCLFSSYVEGAEYRQQHSAIGAHCVVVDDGLRVVLHRVSCVHRSAVHHDKLTDVHRLFFLFDFHTHALFSCSLVFNWSGIMMATLLLSVRKCIIVDAFAWFRWVGHVVPADFFLLR